MILVIFWKKLRAIGEIPKRAILVTADVAELYSSTPHDEGLKVLLNQFDKFTDKIVPAEDITKIAEFKWLQLDSNPQPLSS